MTYNHTLWNDTVQRGSQVELARFLIAFWTLHTHAVWDGGFYFYNKSDSTWHQRTYHACKCDLAAFDGREFGPIKQTSVGTHYREQIHINDSTCTGVLNLAASLLSTRVFEHEPIFFDDAPFGVMCKGAFLRIEGRNIVITPPSHEHRQRFVLDIAYDPAALAPIWKKTLNQWFGTDEDGLRKQALLAQFIGAALFGLSTRYQKALFLVASGGNGKSQLLDVIAALFPPSVLTAIAPQKWDEPYSRDRLARSRLNLVHEIPSSAIAAGSDFKAIITGDLISARKIFSSPYDFHPRAAHIFSANAFPASTDPSDGFWRRILILTMHKRFDGTDEEIHDLAKIIIASELPGVLAWAVEGLRSLLRQDSYTIPQSSRSAVQLSRDSADPFGQWLHTRTTSDKSNMTKSSALFADWNQWAPQNTDPKSQTAFSLALKLRIGKPKHMKNGKFYPITLKS